MLDKEIAAANAREAVRIAYGCEPLSVEYLGGGPYGKAVLAEFGGEPFKAVVKSYSTDGLYLEERRQLDTLRAVSDIPVPVVYHELGKGSGCRHECLIMEYMRGVNPRGLVMLKPRSKRMALALAVADNMDKIHAVTSPNGKFGRLDNPEFDTWEEYYKIECADVADMADKLFAGGMISRETLALIEVAYKNYDRIFYEHVSRPSLIHGGLNVFNMLVDGKALSPTAIIEPFNSMWADAAFDIFQLGNYRGSAGILDECLRRVEPMEHLELRIAYYALFNEIKCAFISGKASALLILKLTKNLIYRLRRKRLN